MSAIENVVEFYEDFDLMDDDELLEEESFETEHKRKRRNSWCKKRQYKKRLKERFLSINPSMDYSELGGFSCPNGIYCHFFVEDGKFNDPRTTYWFNPYTRVYLAKRGNLKVYSGYVENYRAGFLLMKKDKSKQRQTNRRIRHASVYDELPNKYSDCKKMYQPSEV